MPVERDRETVDRYRRISFNDNAMGVPGDRTNACISLSRHSNAVDE